MRRLHGTVIFCLFLSGLVTGMLVTVGSSSGSATIERAGDRKAEIKATTILKKGPVTSFIAWQGRDADTQGKVAPIHVRIEIISPSGNWLDFGSSKGSRITILTSDGMEVISGPIEYKGAGIVEDFKTYSIATHLFEMVPAPTLVDLVEGEFIHGSLVIDMGYKQWQYTLPETSVEVRHWEYVP